MFLKQTIAAGVIALAALAAAPAGAQSFSFEFGYGGPEYRQHDRGWRGGDRRGGYDRALSPQEVRRVLRSKGFRAISYVDRRGSTYQVRATTDRGRRVGLVVSARNGAILNQYRL